MFPQAKCTAAIIFLSSLLTVSACETETGTETETAQESASAFIKANPPVDATMDYPPRTLRVFLSELPNVDESGIRLTGPEGELGLTGLHTMGANDLMVEIEDHPLPNGSYTVNWTAQFESDGSEHSGNYQFTVAVPE